ncbi:hypothetical protein BV25DRAFT_1920517 [Artomyces pyxidatus]|uniref:Uncharacterized protein n=1 Tax=Artomyces pyxidatus TaxID=48021 RepID=A0ACB8SKA9_9AGAM|nr:hypothetical protein BV25DRAFT_1920517 [Artomyces pyxidatus]
MTHLFATPEQDGRRKIFGRHNFAVEDASFMNATPESTQGNTREKGLKGPRFAEPARVVHKPPPRTSHEPPSWSKQILEAITVKRIWSALALLAGFAVYTLNLDFRPIVISQSVSVFGRVCDLRLVPKGFKDANDASDALIRSVSYSFGPVALQALFNVSGAEDQEFASLAVGGRPILDITSPTYSPPMRWDLTMWNRLISTPRSPAIALSPELDLGSCWPFTGSNGTLGIQMAHRVQVSGLTIDHSNTSGPLTPHDRLSAPRKVVLWAMEQAAEPGPVSRRCVSHYDAAEMTATLPVEFQRYSRVYRLLEGEFDVLGPTSQYFPVGYDVQKCARAVELAIVEIRNNWGSSDFTCLYRVRIHGKVQTP